MIKEKIMKIRKYSLEDQDAVWNLHNSALISTGAHAGNGPWDDDLNNIEETYLNAGAKY